MLIGVTGSIGSGKSLVARLLGEMLQAQVHSSDEICRRLLVKGEAGYQKVVQTWSDRYLTDSGEVDRVALRSAVFNDQNVRRLLEDILHPLVHRELLEAKAQNGATTVQIAEVPLLFECGWQDDFDYIVCVTADPDLVLQRVVRRDNARPEDVEKISAVQMDPALKVERSNYHIDNSGSLENTAEQVAKLAGKLLTLMDMNKSN